MAMTNQERVAKALDLLKAGLAPFVEREIHAAVTETVTPQLPAPVVAEGAGSHGLGANVELF